MAAKLVLSMDGLVLKEIPLIKERITIGRKPHNDVQIENLAISGDHAVVVTILNDSFLEDLNSTNGTLVNGQAVKKHVLRNNDVIELGKYKMKYMTDNNAPVPVDTTNDPEKTAGLRSNFAKRGGSLQLAPGDKHSASSVGVVSKGRHGIMGAAAVVQLLNGPNAGKELELTKTLTTLGKPGLQVAVIAKRPLGYFITHVEGETPTVLNGKALDGQAHALTDHDVIEIVGVKMEFFFKA